MFSQDDNDKARARSLLSTQDDGARPRGELDQAIEILGTRHRRARMRREAEDNRFLQALAGDEADAAHNFAAAKQEPSARDRLLESRRKRGGVGPAKSRSLLSGASDDAVDPALAEARAALDRQLGDARKTSKKAPEPEAEREPADEPAARHAVRGPAHDDFDRDGDDEVWQPLIDPMALIGGVLDARKLIVGTTLAGAVLGVMVALATPKKYESNAEILIDPRDIKISDRDLVAGGLPNDAAMAIIENQIRVMFSGPVLRDVVEKLHLETDPEFNGSGGGIANPLSILRALLSGGGGAGDNDRLMAQTTENLARKLSISRGGKNFVVSVGATTQDPLKSAKIANTMVDVYLKAAGDLQSGTAGRAETEINSRLAELRANVEAAERKVEDYKSGNDLVDAQGRLISDDEIIRINELLTAARARTIELKAKADSMAQVDANAVLTSGLPEFVTSSVLSELRGQYAQLNQQAESLATSLGPRHPQLLAVQAQLEGARRQIAAEIRRLGQAMQVELRRAVQQEQELAGNLAQAKARQATVSDKQVGLRELEREAAVQRNVYENYLLRARETAEQKTLNTANVQVISAAQPPLQPAGASRAVIAGGLTVLGFLTGVALGALRGLLASMRGRGDAPTRPSPYPGGRPLAPRPRKRRMRFLDDFAPRGDALSVAPAAAAPVAAMAATPPIPPQPVAPPPFVVQQPVIQQPVYAAPVWPQPQPVFAPPPVLWPQPQPVMQPWPYAQTAQPSPWYLPQPPVQPAPPVQVATPAEPAPAPKPAEPAGPDPDIAMLRDSLASMRAKVSGMAAARRRRA